VRKKESGFQWSIYNSGVSIGTGITAAVGAWLAQEIGFQWVFAITGLIAVAGLLILLKLDKNVAKKV